MGWSGYEFTALEPTAHTQHHETIKDHWGAWSSSQGWSFTTGRNTSSIFCDSVMQLANFCASVRFSGLITMVPSCPLYQGRTATPNHMPQFQKTDRSIAQLTELPPPCRETHAFFPCQCRAETGHRSGFHIGIPKTCWPGLDTSSSIHAVILTATITMIRTCL